MFLGSVSNTALERAADGLWKRQRAIAHNIANEDTPGYKAKRVDFEDALRREIDYVKRAESAGQALAPETAVGRLNSAEVTEYELEDLNGRMDENNVDIDSEYIEQARVQLQFGYITQRLTGYYSNLRYVITGGR